MQGMGLSSQRGPFSIFFCGKKFVKSFCLAIRQDEYKQYMRLSEAAWTTKSTFLGSKGKVLCFV